MQLGPTAGFRSTEEIKIKILVTYFMTDHQKSLLSFGDYMPHSPRRHRAIELLNPNIQEKKEKKSDGCTILIPIAALLVRPCSNSMP
jgi:hypothetical protein